MNIDEMQAGRELDAMIAEKVMEVKEKWLCYDGVPIAPCLIDLDKYDPAECTHIEKHGTNKGCKEYKKSFNVPRYSTDIKAAWEVVDKLKDNYGINIEVRDYAVSCEIHGKFKTFSASDVREHGSVPLVVCRAALKALGVNEI